MKNTRARALVRVRACARALRGLCLLGFFAMGSVMAQTVPDAGSLLQQLEQQRQRTQPAPTFEPPKREQPQELQAVDAKTAVQIDRLRFEGVKVVDADELKQALADRIASKLDYPAMQALARAVGEFYRAKGLWAKAILPPQRLNSGELLLQVFEGRLGNISVSGEDVKTGGLRFPQEQAIAFIERSQRDQAVFNIQRFQEAVKRLDAVPGIHAAGVLKTGQDIGKTDADLRLVNSALRSGSIGLDNNGSRTTGYYGVNASLTLDSPLGRGEQFSFTLSKTQGVTSASAGASVLLDTLGTRFGANFSDMRFTVCCGPLAGAGVQGQSQGLTFTLTHPFAVEDSWTSTGAFSFAHRTNYNEAAGAVSSDKRIDVASAALQMAWPDAFGGDAVNSVSVTYTLGHLDLGKDLAVGQNAIVDVEGAGVQGSYQKLQLNASRLHGLNPKTKVWASLLAQHAFGNLDSGEKISLGGSGSVRAYPGGEGSGDSGAVFTLELRRNLSSAWQGVLFYDYGYVHLNQAPWDGWNQSAPDLANYYQLQGWGAGATWQGQHGLRLTTSLARRIDDNPGANAQGQDGDGTLRLWRWWFNVSRAF